MLKLSFSALLGGLLFLLSLSGCQQQETPKSAFGIVEANQAYRQYFGAPPTVNKGRGFARVGFLPLRKSPDKVRPIPLYLFVERDQLEQMLKRLISGEIILPPDSPLYQPFPADLQLEVGPLEEGTLTLTLIMRQLPSETDLAAIALSLTETSVQFDGVARVRILFNAEPLAQMPAEGFIHTPRQVLPVAPPAMIMIAGMWAKGAEALEEILIDFDRPVTVNRFQLFDAAGKKVAGETFTSVFDMAVVIHPKHPEAFRDGTVLRAEWAVTDALGRTNHGVNTLPLRRFEH
jgi:hypothetical protein